MKKLLCVVVVFCLITAGVFAGGGADKSGGGGKPLVGYVTSNANDLFQGYVIDAFKAYMDTQPNYSYDVQDAQEDPVKQQDQVNNFIVNGAKALVVVPVDTSAMAPITKAAQDAKIPLVYVNRNPFGNATPPANCFYIGSQEIDAGKFQAEALGKLLNGQGDICILMGILANEGAILRTQGNEDTFKEKYPGIKVLAKETGNWQEDQGLTIAENWIRAYPTLKAILANNDNMALGAATAARNANKDLIIMGVDATPDALAAVTNGTLAATVLQDAKGQGEGSAKAAINALSGRSQPAITWIPFVYIDKNNVAQYK
jgi:inositol transport system substrate-binding protein